MATELGEALAPGIQVLRQLGEGGMGIVFLGRDPALRRLVVIKVLLPELARDPSARARFAREAESAAAVSHPSVVSIYQVGALPTSGATYFVMQFVEGPTVQQAFPDGAAAPLPAVRRLLGEVASALAAAHSRGLIHRDIKPSNIMLEAESGRAIVLDFGISAARGARALSQGEKLTVDGTSIGTPEYMSPEQGAGEAITEKSDIYSLGVMGFELLTGRLPFRERSPMALVAAHIKDQPPHVASLRPDLDQRLADLVDLCLAKDAEKRPTADGISKVLLPSAHPLIEWPPPGLDPLRGLAVKLVFALAVIVAGAAGFILLIAQMNPDFGTSFSLAGDSSGLAFGLTLCSSVVLLFTPMVGTRALRLAAQLHWGRREGYPWRFLFDVACDVREDTGALLNGSGRFALLEPMARIRLMRRRRLQIGITAVTLVAEIALIVMWTAGWIGGWATGPELLPATDAVMLLGPVVLGLLGVYWIGAPEWRFGGPSRQRPFSWRRQRAGLRPELVRSWLASAGTSAVGNARRAWVAALAFLPVLLVIVLIGAGWIVFVVVSLAARNVETSTESARTLEGKLTSDTIRPTPWREYDSLFALSARVRGGGIVVDSEAAKRLVGLHYAGASIPSYINALMTGNPATPPPRAIAEVWRPRYRGPLSAVDSFFTVEQIARLQSDTATPVLALFRRLAQSRPLPPLLLLRSGLPGPDTPTLRLRQFQGYYDAGQHNFAAGLLAWRNRDSAAALLRARENIAVARHMMRSPLASDHFGGLALSNDGAILILLTGRVMNDPALVAEFERLSVLIAKARADFEPWWVGGAQLLMADLGEPVLLRLTTPGASQITPATPWRRRAVLSDTTLLPAARAAAAAAVVSGFCLNAREILFGVDKRRRDVLDTVGAKLRNTPRMSDIELAARRELDIWIEAPAKANSRYPDWGRQGELMGWGRDQSRVRWVSPRGTWARIDFCTWNWRNWGNFVE